MLEEMARKIDLMELRDEGPMRCFLVLLLTPPSTSEINLRRDLLRFFLERNDGYMEIVVRQHYGSSPVAVGEEGGEQEDAASSSGLEFWLMERINTRSERRGTKRGLFLWVCPTGASSH
ncbi:hypothetical protein HAX54_050606 [Datura stramonium]|uniref:Uncharacterized protein n=1 Tax=Datura stramonium TaxID=4076 RepID=A0ABS8WP91_DATST|nr:hypothetical protein [Datura stramonium]